MAHDKNMKAVRRDRALGTISFGLPGHPVLVLAVMADDVPANIMPNMMNPAYRAAASASASTKKNPLEEFCKGLRDDLSAWRTLEDETRLSHLSRAGYTGLMTQTGIVNYPGRVKKQTVAGRLTYPRQMTTVQALWDIEQTIWRERERLPSRVMVPFLVAEGGLHSKVRPYELASAIAEILRFFEIATIQEPPYQGSSLPALWSEASIEDLANYLLRYQLRKTALALSPLTKMTSTDLARAVLKMAELLWRPGVMRDFLELKSHGEFVAATGIYSLLAGSDLRLRADRAIEVAGVSLSVPAEGLPQFAWFQAMEMLRHAISAEAITALLPDKVAPILRDRSPAEGQAKDLDGIIDRMLHEANEQGTFSPRGIYHFSLPSVLARTIDRGAQQLTIFAAAEAWWVRIHMSSKPEEPSNATPNSLIIWWQPGYRFDNGILVAGQSGLWLSAILTAIFRDIRIQNLPNGDGLSGLLNLVVRPG